VLVSPDQGAADGQVFGRVPDARRLRGPRAQAAIGLRQRCSAVAEGVRVDGAFERVTAVRGASHEATASRRVEYTRDRCGPHRAAGAARAER